MIKWCLLFIASVCQIYATTIQVPDNLCASDGKVYFKKEIEGQFPFATELSFAAIADHKITCSTGTFNPDKVKPGDSIFVMDWYIEWFLKNVDPFIKSPYILISGDSAGEHPSGAGIRALYNPKIIAWFTRNLALCNHPKLFSIPKGQSIYQWGGKFSKSSQQRYLELASLGDSIKVDYPLMYMSFTARNHSSRKSALELLNDSPFCFNPGRLPIREYYENLAKHKFVLCPRGWGMDTVRFWEASGLNSFPVVEHSLLDELYSDTPCVFVNDLTEITEELLNTKYKELKAKVKKGLLSNDKAFIDYWINKINKIKSLVKAGKWDKADLSKQNLSKNSLNALKTIFKNNSGRGILYIYGCFTGVRPFQMSSALLHDYEHFFVTDKYAYNLNEQTTLLAQHTLQPISGAKMNYTAESVFRDYCNINHGGACNVYLDLTHQQFNFTARISEFLEYLPAGCIIAGNMMQSPYVKTMLKTFENENSIKIQYIDDFWYLITK